MLSGLPLPLPLAAELGPGDPAPAGRNLLVSQGSITLNIRPVHSITNGDISADHVYEAEKQSCAFLSAICADSATKQVHRISHEITSATSKMRFIDGMVHGSKGDFNE